MSNFFQFCPKFVLFDSSLQKVLLCKRNGEADYNDTYSLPGWKVENSDSDIRKGMQREK